MESIIWASDKVDNASQGIYNPLTSGSPHSPGRNGSVPPADGPVRQWRTDLDTLGSWKWWKIIEPSKSVKKKIVPWIDEKKIIVPWISTKKKIVP